MKKVLSNQVSEKSLYGKLVIKYIEILNKVSDIIKLNNL